MRCALLALWICATPVHALAQVVRDPISEDKAKKNWLPLVHHDEFTKSTSTHVEGDYLEPDSFIGPLDKPVDCPSYDMVEGGFSVIEKPHERPVILLNFFYGGKDWIFVSKDQPIRVLSGDSVRSFPLYVAPRQSLEKGGVSEFAEYVLTPDDVDWLASRQSARARVTGTNHICDFPMTQRQLAITELFRDRIVRSLTAASATK
jgi:hypothetical protein